MPNNILDVLLITISAEEEKVALLANALVELTVKGAWNVAPAEHVKKCPVAIVKSSVKVLAALTVKASVPALPRIVLPEVVKSEVVIDVSSIAVPPPKV